MYYPSVLVVGSGGVGVIAAIGLTLNKKSIVTLVVRSGYDHGKLSDRSPNHIAKSVSQFGPFDFVVVTKNIPDGNLTCEQIVKPPITDGRSTLVLIQNGIGFDTPMIENFPNNATLSGNSLKDRLYLGACNNPNIDDEVKKSAIRTFTDIYQNEDRSMNEVIFDEDVSKTRWEKLIYNAVLNTTTTTVNMDVCRCQINDANKTLFEPAMNELISIAKSEGVSVDPDMKNKFLHIGDGSFYCPSMMIDARKKQLFELELILGNPLRIAKKNNVNTPILSTLYSILRMVQFRIKEEAGLITLNEELYQGNSDDYPKVFAQNSK